MDWLVIGAVVVVAANLMFAVALVRASRGLKATDGETRALAQLTQVQGPSGQRFFPDDDAVWELAGSLEDSALAEPQEAGESPASEGPAPSGASRS